MTVRLHDRPNIFFFYTLHNYEEANLFDFHVCCSQLPTHGCVLDFATIGTENK